MSLLTRLMQFTSNEHSPDTFGNKPTDRRRYGTGLMSGDKLSDTINPRRISDLPIEFRSSGWGFTQDLRAKNQCTTGDTNGSSLRWGHFEAQLGPASLRPRGVAGEQLHGSGEE